jgi:hypothetical protein
MAGSPTPESYTSRQPQNTQFGAPQAASWQTETSARNGGYRRGASAY